MRMYGNKFPLPFHSKKARICTPMRASFSLNRSTLPFNARKLIAFVRSVYNIFCSHAPCRSQDLWIRLPHQLIRTCATQYLYRHIVQNCFCRSRHIVQSTPLVHCGAILRLVWLFKEVFWCTNLSILQNFCYDIILLESRLPLSDWCLYRYILRTLDSMVTTYGKMRQ